MNTQRIKSWLMVIFGEKFMAYIQALRFIYLLKIRSNWDPELQIIPRLLNKGDTAIDIGANGADWTYYLHKCVGEEGFIYAFEADPYYALATDIAIRLLRLKGVRLFAFGLSKMDEDVPLRVTDSEGYRVSGLGHVDKKADKYDKGIRVVQLKRLDSLTQECPQMLNTKLIKCDAEGYELYIFQGASDIIEKARPFIILEVGNCDKQGYSPQDLYDYFIEKEYEAFAMVETGTLSKTDSMLENAKALSVNRIFIPQERLDNVKDIIQL